MICFFLLHSIDFVNSGSICGGVLEDPLQAPTCEHIFCRNCIEEWLSRSSTCPIDRTSIEFEQLKTVPRILKNLLNRFVSIHSHID